MSTVAPTVPVLRPRRAVTLRTKLIAGIVALIVLVCAAIGVITEIFLSRYLMQQLDQKLMQSVDRPRPDGGLGSTSAQGQLGSTTPGNGRIFGFGVGALFATVTGGTVHSCQILVDQPASDSTATTAAGGTSGPSPAPGGIARRITTLKSLAVADCAALAGLTAGGPATTVTINGVGSYLVRATPANPSATSSSGAVTVVGLPTKDVSDIQTRLAVIMLIVGGGAIVLGAGIVFLIVRSSVRPLERVAATARKVSTLPLDKGEVDLSVRVPDHDTDTRTEIGQVGAALNQMLGHVSGALEARHASETRVRQFVADASHELRTPLAAIRGYAELARRGEHDPAAVSHALRRVESESSRMTTLVEDLLLLARLDSGRPLATEEVDLTMLVVDRVSDARVAGPDHRWRLDLPDEPVTVVGDTARLHQVLANLLTNARNHTPPGTVVVTGLEVVPDGVVLTVTDDGPGIPAEFQPEIFGRFVRGDSSRSRAAGSTGLGLAIVAAVIAAHGGKVTVDSQPGRTQARVWLPAQSLSTAETSTPQAVSTVQG